MKKRRRYFPIIIALCTLTILWFSGLLPKEAAKIAANNYMSKQEDGHLYEFNTIEYSSAHDSYFASYSLKGDNEKSRGLEIPYRYSPFFGIYKDSKDFKD